MLINVMLIKEKTCTRTVKLDKNCLDQIKIFTASNIISIIKI